MYQVRYPLQLLELQRLMRCMLGPELSKVRDLLCLRILRLLRQSRLAMRQAVVG